MKKNIVSLVCLLITATVFSQSATDKKNIENLCGCFDVQFKYAETFAPDEEYKYHNREIMSDIREFVIAIEKTNKKIILQRLLVINDTMIIKHWREDWTYENPVLFNYKGDMVWEKEQISSKQAKNKWTQSVWEVSDAPRYQGISEWVASDGKPFWQNTTDAPLPRREYSKRKDYNILKRSNRIIVDQNGWIHDQDNQKIIRNNNTDTLLVEEKGLNIYTRTADSKCAAAKTWWENNKTYWAMVRSVWEDYLTAHSTVVLKDQVDGKPLHTYLNDIGKNFVNKEIESKDVGDKIKSTLDLFVSSKPANP